MIVTGGIPRYGSINRSHALARGLQVMFRGGVAMGSATAWYDVAGNNHVTWVAAPSWKQDWVELNGTTQYGPFGGLRPLLSSGSPFTFWCRLNLTAFQSGSAFPGVAGLQTDTTNLFQIGISNNASYLGLHFGSATTYTTLKTSTSAASWLGVNRDVMIVYNGAGAGTAGNYASYIDGVPQSLTSAGIFGAATNTSSVLGASSITGGTNPWNGRIYRAAVWNRELSASEVKMLTLRPDAMFNQIESPIGMGMLRRFKPHIAMNGGFQRQGGFVNV